MKKILFLVFFSLCSLLFVPCSNAQGNLQFNQVLRKEISVSFIAASSSSSISLTVPDGKTWKIESATAYYYSSSTNPEFTTLTNVEIRLGGFLLNTVYKSGLGFYPPNLPIWLRIY